MSYCTWRQKSVCSIEFAVLGSVFVAHYALDGFEALTESSIWSTECPLRVLHTEPSIRSTECPLRVLHTEPGVEDGPERPRLRPARLPLIPEYECPFEVAHVCQDEDDDGATRFHVRAEIDPRGEIR